jgi:Mg2+ and Co2+ transporter CorA
VDERLFFIAVGISVMFAVLLFSYMYFKKWL